MNENNFSSPSPMDVNTQPVMPVEPVSPMTYPQPVVSQPTVNSNSNPLIKYLVLLIIIVAIALGALILYAIITQNDDKTTVNDDIEESTLNQVVEETDLNAEGEDQPFTGLLPNGIEVMGLVPGVYTQVTNQIPDGNITQIITQGDNYTFIVESSEAEISDYFSVEKILGSSLGDLYRIKYFEDAEYAQYTNSNESDECLSEGSDLKSCGNGAYAFNSNTEDNQKITVVLKCKDNDGFLTCDRIAKGLEVNKTN